MAQVRSATQSGAGGTLVLLSANIFAGPFTTPPSVQSRWAQPLAPPVLPISIPIVIQPESYSAPVGSDSATTEVQLAARSHVEQVLPLTPLIPPEIVREIPVNVTVDVQVQEISSQRTIIDHDDFDAEAHDLDTEPGRKDFIEGITPLILKLLQPVEKNRLLEEKALLIERITATIKILSLYCSPDSLLELDEEIDLIIGILDEINKNSERQLTLPSSCQELIASCLAEREAVIEQQETKANQEILARIAQFVVTNEPDSDKLSDDLLLKQRITMCANELENEFGRSHPKCDYERQLILEILVLINEKSAKKSDLSNAAQVVESTLDERDTIRAAKYQQFKQSDNAMLSQFETVKLRLKFDGHKGPEESTLASPPVDGSKPQVKLSGVGKS